MNDLYIKYENGEMLIHMDAFFPSSQSRLNKLLKIIELDRQHEAELKENLKVYFQYRIKESENLQQCSEKEHLSWRQKEDDTNAIIAIKKFPNGLPLSKEELKKKKEDLRYYKSMARITLSNFKQYERDKEQYQKNLNLV